MPNEVCDHFMFRLKDNGRITLIKRNLLSAKGTGSNPLRTRENNNAHDTEMKLT